MRSLNPTYCRWGTAAGRGPAMGVGSASWYRGWAVYLALATLWEVFLKVVDALVGVIVLVDSTDENAFCRESL